MGYPYSSIPLSGGIYLLKVNNGNKRTMCEICSTLTIKAPERRPWDHSDVFIVNFEQMTAAFFLQARKKLLMTFPNNWLINNLTGQLSSCYSALNLDSIKLIREL